MIEPGTWAYGLFHFAVLIGGWVVALILVNLFKGD